MDINDIRGLATVLAMVAFLGVAFWAYSGRKKQDFEEAASLPFADDDAFTDNAPSAQAESQSVSGADGTNKNKEVSQS